MSKHKDKKVDSTDETDDMVSFVPGTSIIDIAAIKRAQEIEDADLNDEEEETSTEELSLDDAADLIRSEMANDPELKKDVLEGYTEEKSDEDLDILAIKVATHTK